jgi:hypothetical protein
MLPSESGRRQLLFERDGYRCRFCGRDGEEGDLVVARVGILAGDAVPGEHELVTACRACAGRKHYVRGRDELARREAWTPEGSPRRI